MLFIAGWSFPEDCRSCDQISDIPMDPQRSYRLQGKTTETKEARSLSIENWLERNHQAGCQKLAVTGKYPTGTVEYSVIVKIYFRLVNSRSFISEGFIKE